MRRSSVFVVGLLLVEACHESSASAPAGPGGGGNPVAAGEPASALPSGGKPPMSGTAGAGLEPEEAGAAGAAGATGGAGAATEPGPEAVFRESTRFVVVDPRDHGARPDDDVDDSAAFEAAVAALPGAGGIVRFAAGTYLKAQHAWRIARSHVLLWAPNRRATIHGTVRARTADEKSAGLCGVRQQAIVFQRAAGGGVYGLRLTSNGTERTSCPEDCHVALDGVDGFDVVGIEASGAPGCGVFAWTSKDDQPPAQHLYLEGNYVHHTYADSIHHTHGTRHSACWRNQFFNEAPSLGDDGIACVTYGVGSPRCGDMEWWNNLYLGGAHGRGMAVVGGEAISIHHNWIVRSASAGLIVASESSYETESVEDVELYSNYIVQSPNGSVQNGHSSILVSGGNDQAGALRDIRAFDNVIVDAPNGRVERAEGSFDEASVSFRDSTDASRLPGPVPTLDDVSIEDTSLLRTRDVSFVPAPARRGLYRIHLRELGDRLEERFEYIVSGAEDALDAWIAEQRGGGARVSESRVVGELAYALVLTPEPATLPPELEPVTFEQLRAGDRHGELSWLWRRVDTGSY